MRAKAKGRPTGLAPEISDLFPDEVGGFEIGDPEGGKPIYDLATLICFSSIEVGAQKEGWMQP